MFDRPNFFFVATVVATSLALPTAAMASELFTCPELKAAVADATRHFASYQGNAIAPTSADIALGKNYQAKNYQTKNYQAKKTMTDAKTCRVVDTSMEDPKSRMRQTGYSCQYPAVSKLDKALRTQLTRCVAGEVEDATDPYGFTIWVDRVSSGEGYRGTEVTATVNPVDGLTLWVRQSVCTNKGNSQACED